MDCSLLLAEYAVYNPVSIQRGSLIFNKMRGVSLFDFVQYFSATT